jgi:O-acetyl-ADP-ribose deacetylase (regulator of RNase III)
VAKVELLEGDITGVETDAIVNAANNALWMGGGVAGAIKRVGGKEIEDEAVERGPIPVGEALVTGAGALKTRYVIHAAVMGTDLETDAGKIRSATKKSLLRAEELGLRSIAFPALGTGVGGFPHREAAEIMLEVVNDHLNGESGLDKVFFVLYGEEAFECFAEKLPTQGLNAESIE